MHRRAANERIDDAPDRAAAGRDAGADFGAANPHGSRSAGALGRAARTACALLETHISFVLVCGPYAYKIKKAVKTEFLDQSTLARRRHACQEELRLNRRLAADLYLGMVCITGDVDAPVIDGEGAELEPAVKMRAFAQEGLWDRLATNHALATAQLDELVRILVPFHAAAAVAPGPGASARQPR